MSDEIQEIKDKIDVADLISEYVQLKPSGVNKKGLCPFHNEKTPSFMVNSERQSWHCFGCNKGGDIFSFTEEMEGMEFKEALKHLADKAGVQLSNYRSDVDSSQKNRIKEINVEAARFFHSFLIKMGSSKPALDYLLGRGLKQETIEEWQVGYIPEQWDLLTQYLLKKGFGIEDLVASGLTIKREGADVKSGRGFYDRFRGRIMFPICNVHGEPVGFTGRLLVEKENAGGKYVNTPQTLVYDKSRVIFGLNKAKKEIKAKDLIIMTEGQTDVIASHQAGISNVVASSGTALTEHQVKMLKRYSKNMNMAFDADEAGQKAAKRGIDIALAQGMDVKVIRIPEGSGKDPDECIKKDPSVWTKSVENAQGIMDWYFAKAKHGKDLSDPKQKQSMVNELLPEIKLIPYAVEKDHWLKQLAGDVGVEVSVLREDMKRVEPEKLSGKKKDDRVVQKVEVKTRFDMLLEQFFVLLVRLIDLKKKEGKEVSKDVLDAMPEKIIITSKYKELYESIIKGYNTDDKELVDILLMKGELEFSAMSAVETEKEVKKLSSLISDEWKKKRGKEIQTEMEGAEKKGDKESLEKLIEEFSELNK